MSTPSKPVNIKSPLLGPSDPPDAHTGSFTTIGTPDLRALRAQYAGTPPPPNIPPRSSPARINSSAVSLLPQGDATPSRPGPQPFGGISALRPSTPGSGRETPQLDIDDLPDEEKVKVLQRHLVSKGGRQNREAENGSDIDLSEPGPSGSRRSSNGVIRREDTEPFPIPYDAPGGDVT